MSFVTTAPEMLAAAAASLEGIGAQLSAANTASAATAAVVPAAGDEVSAAVAARFISHAQKYQAIGARAGAIHDLLVSNLAASARAYAVAEAVNAATPG